MDGDQILTLIGIIAIVLVFRFLGNLIFGSSKERAENYVANITHRKMMQRIEETEQERQKEREKLQRLEKQQQLEKQQTIPQKMHKAIMEGKKVKIIYSNNENQVSQRILSNIRYNNDFDGYNNAHIKAYCHVRNEERSFKICRITSLDIV